MNTVLLILGSLILPSAIESRFHPKNYLLILSLSGLMKAFITVWPCNVDNKQLSVKWAHFSQGPFSPSVGTHHTYYNQPRNSDREMNTCTQLQCKTRATTSANPSPFAATSKKPGVFLAYIIVLASHGTPKHKETEMCFLNKISIWFFRNKPVWNEDTIYSTVNLDSTQRFLQRSRQRCKNKECQER